MATNTATANRVNFTRLRRAHIDLVRALSVLPPPSIIGNADAADLEARADHLQQVDRLVFRYLDAVLTDTVDHIAGDNKVDWREVETALWDSVNDADFSTIAAALQRAGVRFDLRAAARSWP